MSTVAASEKSKMPSAGAIEEIFLEHYQLVYHTACVVTGSPEDAEDVLQTIFLRLLRHPAPPDFRKDSKAYFYKAAVNVSLNTIRARRRQVLVADSDTFEIPRVTDRSDSHEAIRPRLHEAIETLSPRTIEILILRYVHDYTELEIAKLLGISRGTIAVTLFRARSRLRKLVRAPHWEKKT
jgi:RNA polymerase sigma-70 factor (ECF subfamily)